VSLATSYEGSVTALRLHPLSSEGCTHEEQFHELLTFAFLSSMSSKLSNAARPLTYIFTTNVLELEIEDQLFLQQAILTRFELGRLGTVSSPKALKWLQWL